MTLSRDFGLGQSGLVLAGIGLGGDSLEFPSGVAPLVIADAVRACDYFESDFQSNPEDISGGIRVDVYWKQDGTRVWMNREDRTDQYDVDPPWSILGADWGNRSTVSGGSVTYLLGGIQFTPDGTRMMTLGSSTVQHVDMGTAFDITTAGAVVNKFITTSMNKFHWTDDGLTMYVYLAGATKHIVAYPASSAFDVSTLNNIGAPFFDYSSDVASLNSMTLSADGRFVYGSRGSTADELVSWELTTPFDITTATNFCIGPIVNVLSNMTDPRLIFYRPDNGDIHLYGHLKSGNANQRVKVFSQTVDLDITDFSFVQRDTPTAALRAEDLSFSIDGLFMTTVNNSAGVWYYDLLTPWDPSTAANETQASFAVQGYTGAQYSIGTGLGRSSRIYVWRGFSSAELLRGGELPTPGDLASLTNLKNSGTFSDNPIGGDALVVAENDQDVYVLDSAASRLRVHHHRMSTPGDASTSTLQSGSSGVLDISPEMPTGRAAAMCYTPLGTKLFICNSGTNEVFQYDMTVPFDVSTAVYSGKKIDLASSPMTPNGMHVRDDTGRTLFISTGGNTDFFVDIYTG